MRQLQRKPWAFLALWMTVLGAWADEPFSCGETAAFRLDTRGTDVAVLNGSPTVHYGGTLAADETWAAESVHVVYGTVVVPTNATLTVASGAIVKFIGGGIVANGSCVANGAVFTDVDDDAVGGDTRGNGVTPMYTSYVLSGEIAGNEATQTRCRDVQGAFTPEFASSRMPFDTRGVGDTGLGDAVVHDGGTLASSETWAAGSVHVVYGTLSVPEGVTLTIESGAVVKFVGGGMVVDGNCVARGVVFTDVDDDSRGGDTRGNGGMAPAPAFVLAGNFEMDENTRIQCLSSACASFRRDCASDVFCLNTVTNLMHFAHQNEPIAFSTKWDDSSAVRVTVTAPDGTMSVLTNGTAECGGVLNWSPTAWGAYLFRHETDAQTLEATLYAIEGAVVHEGMLKGTNVWSADVVHVINGTVTVPFGGVLEIESGAVVKAATGASLTVVAGGACVAEGVIFTSIADDTVGGDTLNDGAATEPVTNGYAIVGFVKDNLATEYRYGVQSYSGTVVGEVTWRREKTYIIDGTLTVATNGVLTIPAGTVVKFTAGSEIKVADGGVCVAEGVIFTHIADDTVGGDTMGDGDETKPTYGAYMVDVAVLDNEETEYRYSEPISTSGTISGNVVWRARQVYRVTGDLTLASGATLTIAPGSVVKFDPNVSLTVNSGATLNAPGTRSSPIIFTSIKDDEHGGDTNEDGDATKPDSGDWVKICVNGGTANFNYAKILYSSKNATTGAINMTSSGGKVMFVNGEIAHAAYDAIGVESGNCYVTNSVIRNCLLAFRHWTCDPIVNCVIYDCGRLTQGGGQHFYNCIFSRITETWEAFGFPQNGTTYNNCCFWNEGGSVLTAEGTQDALTVCGKDGNIWADPLFVTATNGDFRIDAESPCVDAGDTTVAPAKDWYGQPRYAINGLTPTGTPDANGVYADIGICEVQPRIVLTDVDLAVESVATPERLVAGERATIVWTVKNLGSVAAVGRWTDKVEVVGANGTPVPMGTKVCTTTIVPGGQQTFSREFTVPAAQAGDASVRVTANCNGDIFEGSFRGNNSCESDSVPLSLPTLQLSSSQGGTSVSVPAGRQVGFVIGGGLAEGGVLLIHNASGAIRVWTGAGQVPSEGANYASAAGIGGGVLAVSVPAGGNAYVVLSNEGNAAANVKVEAKAGALVLLDTGLTTAYTTEPVSVSLFGSGFTDGMEVYAQGGFSKVQPSDVAVFDSGRAVVTFAEKALDIGVHAVVVEQGGLKASQKLIKIERQESQPGSVPVAGGSTAGSSSPFEFKVIVKDKVRQNKDYEGFVEYTNVSGTSQPAPYVKLKAKKNVLLRLSKSDAWADTIEFMAISTTYPVSRLKKDEAVRIPFRYKPTMKPNEKFAIAYSYTYNDSSAFPWKTNGEHYMRPTWATDEMWKCVMAVLKVNVGATWNDYLKRMRSNADHLAKEGKTTYRLDSIWQMDINEALGVDHAVSTLASGTDLARGGRGFGLALTRSYGPCLHQRLRKGMFGFGWSHGYGVTCELQESGQKFVIQYATGSSYSFTKADGTWKPEDARDKTTMAETGSEYVLTARSGMVVRFSKDSKRLKSVRDNMGNGIDFSYSGKKLTKVAHTDGQWLKFTYSGSLCTSATDDQGRKVQYAYTDDMLTEVTAFNGRKVKYTYRSSNSTPSSLALRRITAPDGQTRDFTYDELGRVHTVARNGSHFMTEIVRGAHGSYSIIAPNDGVTTVKVGSKGETLSTVNALGQKVKRTYTAETQLESIVSPSGKTARIEYDSDGQAVKTIDAAGAETTFAYTTDFGALKSVTDAKRHAIEYGYDKQGRSESIVYPDKTKSRIAYSSRGDVIRATNAKGETITYSYDGEGRKTAATWPNGRTFKWAYDAKGNCTNASDSVTGAVTMEYDAKEQLIRITYPKGRGFTYEYDAYGRVTKRTMLGGTGSVPSAADIQRYSYDGFGRVSRMTDGDGNLYVANAYDPVTGDLVTQTYGNGTVVSNAYDILGRIVAITHRNAAGDVLESFAYTYNEDGQRTALKTTEGVETYAYDAVGQLTRVTYPDGSDESFAYDAVGNRTSAGGSRSVATETYTVNNLNQYTEIVNAQAARSTMTYDLDGNLATRTDLTSTTRYYYNCEDRLVGVTNETAGVRWSCEYDVFGNRVMVDDNGTVTEKLYVQGSLPSVAAEFDGEGTVATHHILIGSTRLADVSGTGGSPVQTRYYHSDGLASTRLLTDANGAVTARASYNAFGSIRSASGESISAGWVGTLGVERDSTGHLFMRNRYYDPSTGRFTQRDPIGHAAGDVNWYRYCGNDGVNGVDVDGTTELTCDTGRPYNYTDVPYTEFKPTNILEKMFGDRSTNKYKGGDCVYFADGEVGIVPGSGKMTVNQFRNYLNSQGDFEHANELEKTADFARNNRMIGPAGEIAAEGTGYIQSVPTGNGPGAIFGAIVTFISNAIINLQTRDNN